METLDERFGTSCQRAANQRVPQTHSPLRPWANVSPSNIHLRWCPSIVPLLLRFLPAGSHRLPDAAAPSSDPLPR